LADFEATGQLIVKVDASPQRFTLSEEKKKLTASGSFFSPDTVTWYADVSLENAPASSRIEAPFARDPDQEARSGDALTAVLGIDHARLSPEFAEMFALSAGRSCLTNSSARAVEVAWICPKANVLPSA
jgi:hypothetical protein